MRPGLRDWADRDPARAALVLDGGAVWTYAELEARSNRFAQAFRANGLARGDHVAALVGNAPEIVALCWAAHRTGVYLTPVPTRLSPRETAYIVANSTARLVFAAPDFSAQLAEVGVPVLPLDVRDHPADPVTDESPGALMMYSSGTTGAPKGILRPLPSPDQAHLLPGFARDLVQLFGLSDRTRYLSTQPLYHAAALRFVLAVTAAGGTAVVMPKFDAARALELIDAHGLTTSQWVPTMFRRLLALPEDLRAAFSGKTHVQALHGAAPCTPALKRAMMAWWGPILTEYYSGSEGVGLTMIDGPGWLAHPGSVGPAIKGRLHILGPDDAELPPGETGRIFFSGIPPFAYLGDPEKTAGKTSRQGYQTFGDIGHVESDGYLYLSDRADDMIISGGVNLYPQEIEAAIESAPHVAACGVVGMPDPEFEERPVAFVVPAAGAPDDLADLVRSHLDRTLGRVKHPREIVIVESLPVTETGKLLRRALRALPTG
ncbi:AMP-binding protein [Mesobacterium pallidum]|uniref:AMP-binding protein n=1 Tax=Mesobacterium pallidum TaxID=2872037 RepID=UPI001EE2AC8A|nr:AMP-binding protein [Mesobacterium pallidum]